MRQPRIFDHEEPNAELLRQIAESSERVRELAEWAQSARQRRDGLISEACRMGLDLRKIARAAGLSSAEVIALGGEPDARRAPPVGPIQHQLRTGGIEVTASADTKERALLAAESYRRIVAGLVVYGRPTFMLSIVDPGTGSQVARIAAGLPDELAASDLIERIEESVGGPVRAIVTPLGTDGRAVPWTWPVLGPRRPSRRRPIELVEQLDAPGGT